MATTTPRKRRMGSSRKVAAFFAAGFALMAILITEVDDLPPPSYTPFFNLVQNHTDCCTVADASGDDCIQTVRQTRSLVSAMAAAIFTIISATATEKWRVASVVAAGGFALKAVFNQMMYISNGDLTFPIAILVVSALCTVCASGVWLSAASEEPDQDNEDSAQANEGQ